MSYFFTSESVSEGHPDKVSDQISDALLDHFLAFDPYSKVACETMVTTGQVFLAGEVKSNTYLDLQKIAREAINKIGYTKSEYMFDGNSCGVLSAIHEQSDDIKRALLDLVKINTYTANKKGVDAGMDALSRLAEDLGFTVKTVNGRHRLICSGNETTKPRVMLISHMDTVFPPDGDFLDHTDLGDGFLQDACTLYEEDIVFRQGDYSFTATATSIIDNYNVTIDFELVICNYYIQ